MTAKKLFLFWMLLLCQFTFAQVDSIALKEVIISDSQLKKFSNTQLVLKLNDSVIEKNKASLTSLLNYNSTIYFKENGLGMVSSPSFRGTTAQQTAVIWNGININSQLNGQTDFNTISTKDFQNIAIRSGGGSAIYGSSAIGGSIHLNNELHFKNEFRNELLLDYGSFNTFGGNYKIIASDEKVSANLSVSRNSSDNDYDYIESRKKQKNENGQFYNTSLNAVFGYKINHSNFLKFYSQLYEGERHFSLISPSDTKTKYKDLNTRNLLEWNAFCNKFVSKVKAAFLKERYQYFGTLNSDNFSFGQVDTFISKYDLTYNLNQKMQVNAIVDYTKNKGSGSDILNEKREIGSAAVLFKQKVTQLFQYELALRKEATSNYKSPILFSVGTAFSPLKWYRLKLNFSRNFRIPTFNDLYWQGAGNPDLKPEHSYQGEIGNEFTFGHFVLTATVFKTEIRDMIHWLPGKNGIFSPENVDEVGILGFESAANYDLKFGNNHFNFAAAYGYTDSRNLETDKQLIYVPFHKATGNVAYGYRKFSVGYQHLLNGFVFTQSDNSPTKTVKMYNVSNAFVDYNFGKINTYKLGFKVLNIWKEKYESVEARPLPGRNFNVYLILNF